MSKERWAGRRSREEGARNQWELGRRRGGQPNPSSCLLPSQGHPCPDPASHPPWQHATHPCTASSAPHPQPEALCRQPREAQAQCHPHPAPGAGQSSRWPPLASSGMAPPCCWQHHALALGGGWMVGYLHRQGGWPALAAGGRERRVGNGQGLLQCAAQQQGTTYCSGGEMSPARSAPPPASPPHCLPRLAALPCPPLQRRTTTAGPMPMPVPTMPLPSPASLLQVVRLGHHDTPGKAYRAADVYSSSASLLPGSTTRG